MLVLGKEEGRVGGVKTVGLLLAKRLLESFKNSLEVRLHLLAQVGHLFPQFSRSHALAELQGSLLHLILIFLDVGLQLGPQILQMLRQLFPHNLHDGHQLGLGLLPVGWDLLLQALDHWFQHGFDFLHVLALLDHVLIEEGLQHVSVVLVVLLQNLPELLTLGLELLAEVLHVLGQLLTHGSSGFQHLGPNWGDGLKELLKVAMDPIHGLAQEFPKQKEDLGWLPLEKLIWRS